MQYFERAVKPIYFYLFFPSLGHQLSAPLLAFGLVVNFIMKADIIYNKALYAQEDFSSRLIGY